MEEDFFGYSDLDITAKNSKLSNLIQYLEDEITFLESDQGCAAATVVLSSETKDMSESEIELSEDELETGAPHTKVKDDGSNNSAQSSDLDTDQLEEIESEERAIEESTDGVTETVEITSVSAETEIAATEARSEPESAVAATDITDTVQAACNKSDEIASAVLTDILNFVTSKDHVQAQSNVAPKPNERPSRLATEVKTLVSEVPSMEELKADSIVVGGRTLRARTSTTPAPLSGNRSRNSSGDSNTSQSRRTRTSSAVETIAERRQSRSSVEADSSKEGAIKAEPVPEGRVLRRRHNSNDSGKSDQPARKTRSVRSVSNENADQSSRESTPSVVSTQRLSPRNRSPARAKSPGKESIVVNLPRKKKKKDGFDGKARAEADILKRISELQSQGLWTGKKLSKNQEERGKFHWDFVIEEMVWLSGVVQQELKTKKMLAKKCAVMVQKHFKDKEMAEIRAEKAREANLRRIASLMAREVKNFWGDVNKLFEYRLKIKLDAKKKEALDQHLNYIVDKTEKYSTLLAESMADNTNSVPSSSGAPSRAESVMSEEEADHDNDGEYNPDVDSDDDEETIEKEEEDNNAEKNHEKEINELEDEAEVPIEELLKKYYPDQFGNIEVKRKDETAKKSEEGESSQLETKPKVESSEESVDASKDDQQEKVDEENTVSPDEDVGRSRRKRKPIDIAEVEAKIKAEEEESKPKSEEGDAKDKTEEDKLEEYASLAATFQPTGNTLDTTTVKTKVPFLLKHTLREYQHIGLDWMVSLFERNLNGILADEMGLGKTIQTIAFLAHLASDRENWGPHLIVVPTSVMLNWEMEIKKWCPGFKVLVYYGSQKERRLKRVGWTKQNAFHICITSYKLVIQDHSSFRRFKWQYFILDEAQHIKNFKSQRWQLLLNFTSVGRLLLTGTPLQNNLMELWSLMHFLMPHVFESHRDFKEWFSNPMSGMVEGNMEYNNELVKRLHKVLRPFILRRLKSEVEKQLPKKYEHLVKCSLSKRQRYLYDDFMSRAKTKEILASGNLLSVINVLMQLRKCCNHPNLFEPRPTLSPFVMSGTGCVMPAHVSGVLDYQPLSHIHLDSTPLMISPLETKISGYTWFRCSTLKCPPITMLNPPDVEAHLSCPKNKIRLEVRNQMPPVIKAQQQVDNPSFVQLEQTPSGPVIPVKMVSQQSGWLWQSGVKFKSPQGYFQLNRTVKDEVDKNDDYDLVTTPWHPPLALVSNIDNSNKEGLKRKATDLEEMREEMVKHGRGIFNSAMFEERISTVSRSPSKIAAKRRKIDEKLRLQELELPELKRLTEEETMSRRKRNLFLNDRRADLIPMYGTELTQLVQALCLLPAMAKLTNLEALTCKTVFQTRKHEISCYDDSLLPSRLVYTLDNILSRLQSVFSQFIMYIPAVHVPTQPMLTPVSTRLLNVVDTNNGYPGDFLQTRFQISTPDTRLIQYDCGKLQVLAGLLHKLQAGGHRALIFTQMTKMLDVLEAFLNYHGYVYMRLDGSTKVETRQCLMERFNNDKKYFIFILSTRSGGVGINLTGADTVIFYDSDWNPTMDAQAQDRCHRIGQTRDVHIYRLVSERTVEENIIKKANQKKLLGDLAIEGGNFTTAFFKKSTINDLFNDNTALTEDQIADEEDQAEAMKKKVGAFETALATAEEDHDVQATKQARAEENEDENDFKEEEDQFNAVLSELKSVERYALKHLEWEQKDFAKEQLDFAQAAIEARKEEFDAGKLDELTQEMREELGLSSEEEEDDGNTDEASEAAEDDYAPDGEEADDENTIEKDEKQEQKDEFEINMLENEAEIPVEDLIKLYYPDQWRQMQEQGEGVGVVEVGTNGGHEAGHQVNGGRRSTRSRGNVEINLWELENPEDQLRSAAINHQA